MSEKIIFTLDSRENTFLEITKNYFSLSDNFMHSEIGKMHNNLKINFK